MNRLAILLQSEACETLLFALTHTLWQALLIAAGLWLFLRTRRTNHPGLRYNVAVCAMLAVIVAGLATWAILNYEPASVTSPLPVVRTPAMAARIDSVASTATSLTSPQSGNIESVVSEARDTANWRIFALALWFTGTTLMLGRVVWLIIGAGRLRSKAKPLADPDIISLTDRRPSQRCRCQSARRCNRRLRGLRPVRQPPRPRKTNRHRRP